MDGISTFYHSCGAHQTVTSSRASTEISALKSLDTGPNPSERRLTGSIEFCSGCARNLSQQVEMAFRDCENARRPFGKLSLRSLPTFRASSLSCPVARKPPWQSNRHVQRPAVLRGCVPTPFSNRVPNEYCASCREVLSVDNDPLPLLTSPRQTAVALRSISRPFQSDQAFDGI